MARESTLFRASGWLLIVCAVVLIAVLATAAPAARSPLERLAAGEAAPITPRPLSVTPQSIVPESIETVRTVSIDQGFSVPSPLGGSPGPQPADAPFAPEVPVANSVNAETSTSIAGEPSGSVLYAAYTIQTGANRDVFVARSTNGGTTWTAVGVGTAPGYNEFDPRVVVHGTRVFVFFAMDDAAFPRAFQYGVSTNQGTSWTVNRLNYGAGAPFRDLRNPDASSADGQWLYVTYGTNCDGGSPTGPPCFAAAPAYLFITILFDAGGVLVPPTIYFPFGIDIVEPTIVSNAGFTYVAGDILCNPIPACGGPPGSHDIVYGNTTTGFNTASSWANFYITGLGAYSTDILHLDAFGYGPNFVFVYQVINAGLGFPNHVIFDLYTQNAGATFTLDSIAGGGGVEFKDPAGFGSVPLMHVTFFQGGNLGYAYSLDAATSWTVTGKVNSNTGSVQDLYASNDVTYAGKVRVAFQDNRAANNDILYSTFTGFSFYIFDRSPRVGTLTVDANPPTAVPFAYLWPVTEMHTVVAPATDPAGPGVRYVFLQWSDATTNPSHAITVGAADTVLIAQYTTEYFLDISAPVGTVSPVPGWFASGATVTIQWTPPAPAPRVQYVFNGWTGAGPGSYTGTANPTPITMNGPITEVADALRQLQQNIDTTPTGLQVIIDGGAPLATPQQPWWDEGTPHTIQAITPQSPGAPTQRYVFARWVAGATTPTISVTATTAADYTAIFDQQYQVQIASNPVGRTVNVDGSPVTAPVTAWWLTGSTHLVDVTSPQTVGTDTRYNYQSWSDAGAQSHTVGPVTTPLSLTVTFTTEYRYAIDTTPPSLLLSIDGGANVSAPQVFWWLAGQSHAVRFVDPQTVAADTRRTFFQWSDGATANPRTFQSGTTTTGNYLIQTYLEYRWQFATVPPTTGAQITVNGVPITVPGSAWLRDATTASIAAPSPSPDPTNPTGIRYVWQSWSNGGLQSQAPLVSGPLTLTATYGTQYFLTINSPYGTPTGSTWYTAGTTAFAVLDTDTVVGGAGTRYKFVQWSLDATGTTFSQSNPIAMNGPKTATAVWKTQYQLTIVQAPTSHATAICSVVDCWYDSGTPATVTLSTILVPDSTDPTHIRYRFDQWSGGASGTGGTSNPITMSSALTATANWVTQYYITVNYGGQAGITPRCNPAGCWADAGTTTATVSLDRAGVDTVPGQTRIGFNGWQVGGNPLGGTWQASNTFPVTAPVTVTVLWTTQHHVILQGDVPFPGSLGQVTCLVASDCWYNANSLATLSRNESALNGAGTEKWVFASWGGAAAGTSSTASTASFNVGDGAKTVTVTWTHRVRVTVTTTPSIPEATITVSCPDSVGGGAYFCDINAPVTITVPAQVTSGGKTYIFVSWSGGASGGTTGTVTPNAPVSLVAQYREQGFFETVAGLGAIIGIVVAVLLLAFFLWWRRRKGAAEAAPPATAGAPPARPQPPSPPGAAGTMECPNCGLTVEAKAGPCPICGAELTPPVPVADDRVKKLEDAYRSGRITKEQYQANMRRLRGNA